jgi:hypothetical protein
MSPNIKFIVTSVRTDNTTQETEVHSVMCLNLIQVFDHLDYFVNRRAEYNFTTFKLDYYVQAIEFFSTDPMVTCSIVPQYRTKSVFISPLLKFTDQGTPIWATDNVFYKEFHNNEQHN